MKDTPPMVTRGRKQPRRPSPGTKAPATPQAGRCSPTHSSGKTKAPRLSRPVHRDLAHILAHWGPYIKTLRSEAFALLVVLEGIRLKTGKTAQFHYRHVEEAMGVSSNTLRRWLRALKATGLVTTQFVPGSNRSEAYFTIHLESEKWRRRRRPITSDRTVRTGRGRA